MRITFRDFNTGRIKQVPIKCSGQIWLYQQHIGIKRKNNKRTIQLQSNVTDLTAAASINQELERKNQRISKHLFHARWVYLSDRLVETNNSRETNAFLGKAFIISLGMIFFDLVLQFNFCEQTFHRIDGKYFSSVIGVFLGFALTGMTMPTIMVLVGVIGLALLLKRYPPAWIYPDELRSKGMKTREAAIQAGKIRIIPVLLTAVATILGFVPLLAIGFNIDFGSLFTHLDPKIFWRW